MTAAPASSERVVHLEGPSCAAPRSIVEEVPSAGDLAARLYAAKPITWRGRGDLAQVPWSRPCRGTWLVLDCWSGMGGLCIELLQLGWHFYAASAEMDPMAAKVALDNMPNLVHVHRVEDLQAKDFLPFLRRRKIRGIVMGGGSPCQGNSSLNVNRRSLADPRSHQPQELSRLAAEFEALPECSHMELVVFLENVASMTPAVRDQYSSWLAGPPVCVDAATCGWVQRKRFFWLFGKKGPLHPGIPPPLPWAWKSTSDDEVPTLIYEGPKPCPPRVFFQNDFKPLFDPSTVVARQGHGALHTFTREFRHPTDRVGQVSAAAAARFEADLRRFPPVAYEERSLLWSDDKWRPPHGPKCMAFRPPVWVQLLETQTFGVNAKIP